MQKLAILTTLAVSLGLMGCTTKLPDTEAGEFAADQGQETQTNPAAAYPEGATGWEVGSVIAPLSFVGYADFTDPANVGVQLISLSDFYNPDGAGTYPADHPYKAGQPKPKAVNVVTSAVWCPPCNQEAKTLLPGKYTEYSPKGGTFMTVLLEAGDGSAATFGEITDWANSYEVKYFLVVDPSRKISGYTPPSLPSNLIVRTKDMKIIKVTPGIPQQDHWTVFEKVLNDEVIPGVD